MTVWGDTWSGIANSGAWGDGWTNPLTTTAAINDVQSGLGRQSTGTVGSFLGYVGFMTTRSWTDFDLRVDYTVVGAGTNGIYPNVGFRANTTWEAAEPHTTSCYWFEFERLETGFFLYDRTSSASNLLASNTSYVYADADIIHFRLNVIGTTIKTRVWKNSETEPGVWDFTVVNSAHAGPGRIFLSVNGGSDTTADEARWDNLSIDDLAAVPAVRAARRVFT